MLVSRSRTIAFVGLVYLLLQFPLTTIPIAPEYKDDVPGDKLTFPVSVVQVAVTAYSGNDRIPKDLLRALLLPGSAFHDAFRRAACELKLSEQLGADCSLPSSLGDYEGLLEQVQPRIYRPDIVSKSVARAFRDSKDLIQAGCSLTVGSAVISLFIPAKMGLFGYALMLFVIFKAGFTPTPHAFVFAVLLAVAADVFSLFGGARNPAGGPQVVAVQSGGATGAKGGAKRRAPRDTVSASDAKKAS